MQPGKGIIKACKYSFAPNALGYCGSHNYSDLFSDFITAPSEEKEKEVREALETFEGMHPYLKVISSASDLNEFDEGVIEAYWLGNKLLEKTEEERVREMILNDFKSLPFSIRKEKAALVKKGVFPHHSFHVLIIQFITGKVKPFMQNLDNCLAKPALVLENKKDSVKVKTFSIELNSGKLLLAEKRMLVGKGFVTEPKKGDLVSVHWEQCVERISQAQEKNLKKYTLKNTELFNSLKK